jgi:hypothetical protein
VTDTALEAPSLQGEAGTVRDFIEAVLGDQRGNVVMGLVGGRMPTGKPIINRARWFSYPQQIGDMVRLAEQHAEEDVYLSPIVYGDERDAKGRITRAKTNALTSRAIYMDSDTCPPDRFRLPPSIHVDSSPGHGQDYWLLAEPIPAPRAAAIAHRISLAHKADGTDPSGWSSSKFLRIPTVNLSYGEPFPVQWTSTGELYVDLDVEGAYDDVQLPPDFSEPDLPDTPAAIPLYDRVPAGNARLIDLLEHSPKVGDKGWRSEQRWGLLLELMRAGFDDQETLSLAWHAQASSKWREDARGVSGLWGEVVKARANIEAETGTATPPAERRNVHTAAPVILTDEERKAVLNDGHFLQRYVDWANTRVGVMNRPLHEMNAWTYLSTIWCEIAHVWRREGGLPLNLYSVSIAESSSGKSEAARLMMQAINAAFPHESPQIAVDQSKNALIENLLLRDGAVAFARSDEADATFKQQRDAPWAQGVQQAWTEVYDGWVPQHARRPLRCARPQPVPLRLPAAPHLDARRLRAADQGDDRPAEPGRGEDARLDADAEVLGGPGMARASPARADRHGLAGDLPHPRGDRADERGPVAREAAPQRAARQPDLRLDGEPRARVHAQGGDPRGARRRLRGRHPPPRAARARRGGALARQWHPGGRQHRVLRLLACRRRDRAVRRRARGTRGRRLPDLLADEGVSAEGSGRVAGQPGQAGAARGDLAEGGREPEVPVQGGGSEVMSTEEMTCLQAAAEVYLGHAPEREDRMAAARRLAEYGVLSNRNLEAICGLPWYAVAEVTGKTDRTGGRLAPHTLPLMVTLAAQWGDGIRNRRLLKVILDEGTSQGMVSRLTGIPVKAVERLAAR